MNAAIRRRLVIAAFCLGAAAPAGAGTVFVSGDYNLGDPVRTEGVFPPLPDNDTWFTNILGAGATVLIHDDYYDTPGTAPSDDINNHYNGLGGITSILDTSGAPITSASLSGVDLFISMLPSSDYAASEISALNGFLAGSGSVFFMGDNGETFTFENERINAALAALEAR